MYLLYVCLYWQGRMAVADCQINNQSINQSINQSADLDFFKAFDTVPHQRLLTKLAHNGIQGDIYKWINFGFHSILNVITILGLIINDTMQWSPHINNLAIKASKVLNFIKHNNCSSITKASAYLSLVRPIMEYASCVWDPHEIVNIQALEKVQQRAPT